MQKSSREFGGLGPHRPKIKRTRGRAKEIITLKATQNPQFQKSISIVTLNFK